MAKQLNVNLAFTADTSKARSQLQELQNQLSKLTSAPAQQLNLKWTQEIQEATTAAMELKTHLKNAMNVETGTLDFTKLNSSIKSSGKSLAEYGRQLQSLGPSGQQAFMQLAGAVAQSEIPIRRSNAALKEMMTTLKNTARWQLSSSMLHGFMGAVQSAYGYAQDLNASLNDIRIVTGQTTDQMAKFAEQANKAAKALSTNTTDYTNASLIYYQQGLSDAEVAKRTEVTVKMANAAGQSAQVVSDQLTSVWNNFYDGSKSLEYYADVMTALGAATASSTDEIAGGLEKFAAVADTIGLSYEYAASALATITSNTRQSEEVVGTALKTIFARIQGLNLGETLEDGTTLNKYSEALQKVGISIFESNGEIKKMDDILDEMASKWQTLAKDQQIALAQTVAGVRQYNQLVSLMDNWNAGDADSMTANLKTAYGASGELQKQADIYAESWEAAQERVQAASEAIFQSLLDEDFFIGILNGLEKVLTYIDNTIDSLGGLRGVLSTVGVLMTKVFSEQMASGLRNMAHNIYMSTEGGRQAAKQEKYAALDDMQRQMSLGYDGTGSISGEAAAKQYSQQIAMQKELIANSERMSESELANAQQLLDLRRQIGDQVIRAAEAEEQAKDKLEDSRQQAFAQMGQKSMLDGEDIIPPESIQKFETLWANMKKLANEATTLKDRFKAWTDAVNSGNMGATEMIELREAVSAVGAEFNLSDEVINDYMDSITEGGEEAKAKIQELLNLLSGKQGRNQASMMQLGVDKKTTQEIVDGQNQIRNAIDKKAEAERRAKMAQEEYTKSLQSAKGVIKDWANGLVSGAQAVMSFASIVNSAKGAIDALTNPDMSGWEKFFSVLQSGAMIVTMTVSMFNSLAQARKNWEKGTLKNAAATLIEAAATTLSTKANEKNAQAQHRKAAGHEHDSKAAKDDAVSTAIEGEVTEQNNNKNVKSNKKLGESFGKLKKSAGEWVKAYKGQIGGAVAVAAAIAIVVTTISTAINQYNRFEKAAAEASAASEMMASKYSDAKNAYDTFSNTLSGYKDAVASLEDLTKGTAEYTEATMRANEQALELINNYKGLAGQYTIEDGLIVIDEDALARVQQAELEKVGRAQAMNILSSAQAREAQSKADRAKYNREMDSKSDDVWTGRNSAAGAVAGGAAGFLGTVGVASMIGASLGPIGMAIGAVVGAAIGGIGALIATEAAGAQAEAEAAATNKVIEYVQKNGNDIFAAKDAEEFGKMLEDADLKIDDTNLVESLYANKDALEQLTAVEVAKLNQEYADWQTAYAAYNMGNSDYANAESQAYLNNVAYDTAHDQATIDSVTSGVQDLWAWSNDDFWKAYLEEVLGDTNVDEGSTTGDNYRVQDLFGEGVTLQKKNADGVWEDVGAKDGLSEDVAEQQLINARLMAKANEGLTQNIADYQALAYDLLVAGVSDSDNAKTIIEGYSSKTGKVDLSKMLPETVNSIVADAIQDPDLRKAVSDAVEEYKKNVPSWYNGLTASEKELAWSMNIDKDASIDEVKSAVAAMQGYLDSVQLMASLGVFSEMEGLLKNQDWRALKTKFDEQGWTEQDWLEFMSQGSLDAMSQWLADKEESVRDEGRQDNEDGINAATDYHNTQVNEYRNAIDDATATQAESDALGPQVTTASEAYNKAKDAYATTVSQKRDEYVNNSDAIWAEAYSYMDKYNAARPSEFELDGETYYYHDSSLAGMTDFLNNMDTTGPDQAYLVGQLQTLFNGFENSDGFLTLEQQDAISHLANYFSGSTDVYGMDLIGDGDPEAYQEWVNKLSNVPYINNYTGVDNASYVNDIIASIIPYLGETDGAVSDARNMVEQAWEKYFELDYKYQKYQGKDGLIAEAQAKVTTEKEDITGKGGSSAQLAATYQAQIALQESLKKTVEAANFSMEEFGAYYQQLEAQHIVINGLTEGTTAYAVALEKITLTQMRTNRGLETLATNWEDWNEVMSNGDASINDIVKIMPKLNSAMADILDLDLTDVQALPADFMQKNWPLIEQVINGAEGAMEKLQGLVAKEYFLSIGVDGTGLNAQAQAAYSQIDTWLSNMPDLEAGITLNDQGMTSAFQTLMAQAHMTVAEMEAAFDAFGFTPEIKVTKVELPQALQQLSGSGFVDVVDPLTGQVTRVTTQEQMNAMASSGEISIASINGDASVYKGGGGSNVVAPTTSGGGGGSKPKKAEKVKKSDVVKRYKEIDDLMDDLTDKMEDAAKAADRLYGKGRIDQMKKNNELLKQEIELTKKKKEEALKYLDEDKKAMFDAASEAGVKLNIDENGLITNYTSAMTELYKELDAEITAANKDGNADEEETERIDAIQKRIDELQSAIDQYDETRELIEDLDNQLDEQFYQWQDNNYQILTYELEIKLELNDDELKLVDYHLNKIADDFYQMAEAAALMVDAENSLTGGSQLDVYRQNLEDYQAQKEALDAAYANGEISQDAYIEGLREVQDGMLSNLESLNELDDSMMHYYGETLNMAMEEMAKYTERMEHLTSVLDHYQSLMEIMGKSTDYKSMGVVLEGKAKTLEHQTDVAKQAMEMYKSEADERYAAYQQALLDGDSAAAELYLQQYEDALAAANQAEEEYLASAEEWAEALTAVLENKLSELGQTLENALTGGTSFDQLTTSMERAAALQEEYLTTTNKIYETNKLMRQAQQEIDKTSNTVAKRRLQSFIQETNQLQNQTKLSNYELEIQQAKYDLLLAEIALEEAQNAKSTVRLQRDNEGNFGYVYTADGAAVAEAEQDMLDKQNRLYNLALDGANEYSEKYQQTLNEMYDTLTDLQQQYLDGAFETEQEYHAAVEAAKQYYYEKLQQYSSLHTVAITLDTRVINDAWSSGFNDMIANTEEWMGAVDIYINQVGDAFTRWGEYMDQIAADTGTDLDSLEQNVKDITDESEALKETLIGEDGVIDAIQAEIDAVVDAVEKYATLRSSLQELKTGYEEVAAAIRAVVAAQSQVNTNPPVNNTTYTADTGGREGSVTDDLDIEDTDNGSNPDGKDPDEEETEKPPLPNRAITYAYQSRGKYYTYKSASEAAKKAPSDTSAIYMTKDKRISNDTIWAFVGFAGDLTSASFDTGGYTGQWGSYGKMAMLHEKELVLNKGDTENFLTAMGVLDRIVQTIDLQSANAQLGGLLMSPTLGYNRNDVLEQNIKIEASFPNATDKIEIEEAFMSLANLASQYANRK